MIYQPKSIQPSYKSIDGSVDNEISMVMNTTEYVTSYKLTIYNMDNTIFYDGAKTDFIDNLYNGETGYISLPSSLNLTNGKDYKWTAKLYQDSSNMLITYGNVISPTTYTYTVGSGGLSTGNYHFNIGDSTYIFTIILNLVNTDVISFDTSSELTSLISQNSQSSYYLSTTKLNSNLFATLTLSNNSYMVGSDGLPAGDYHFAISGVDYWFTTLSDLSSGDTISFNSTTGKITQTHSNISITLNYISSQSLNAIKSENATTNVYLQRNINIKSEMVLEINDERKTISSYDSNTGLAIVSSAFSNIPDSSDEYTVYSDFIETMPENLLYVRSMPSISIIGASKTLTSKSASFSGTYTQSEDVPLVYYLWNLYSVDGSGKSLIKKSKKKYSANIVFEYDGFKNGETYSLELICENEFGIISNTESIFTVNYDEVTYDEQPVAEQTDEQGIRISWLTTVLTEPYSIYTKNAVGYIQSDDNTVSQLWLEPNQSIYPNTIIVVGVTESEGVIESYNINTGYTTLSEPLNYVPTIGEYYHIYSEPNYDLTGINIETNTPYSGVNSANIGDNHLIYYKNTGLATYPDDFQLTMQFMVDDNFFYGENNVYQDMALIARYEGNDTLGLEDLMIFAKGYRFYAISPSSYNGALVGGIITGVEEDGSAVYVSISYPVNISKQQFICFTEQEYVAFINSYDSTTNKITLDKNIPAEYIPEVGDAFFLYDTVSASYYDTPNNVFCLQKNNFISPYSDYVWTDSGTWDDKYYWLEGGTPIGRASNTWWKVRITPEGMIIERGGV